MAGIGSVVVQFLAQDKMTKTVHGITDSLKGVGKSSDESKSKLGKFAALTAGAFAGIGGLVIGVGVGMIAMAKGAQEDAKQAAELARVLGTLKGVTQDTIDANADWIDSMQLATHVSDTDLRVAMSTLALATQDVGKAQRLTALAVDVAAGSGKNLTTIVDALAKATSGNTDALKRQMPWLDANHDGSVSLKEAIDGLTKAYGGAAQAAAKQDVWESLGIIWDELQESLGGVLLPLLDDLANWFGRKANRDKVQNWINKFGELAGVVGGELSDKLKELIAWLKRPENLQKLQDWADALGGIARSASSVVGAIQQVIHWMDKLPKFPSWWGGVLRLPFNKSAPASGPPTPTPGYGRAPDSSSQTIMVTEEQIYRAVHSLLLRGDARNGRTGTRIA